MGKWNGFHNKSTWYLYQMIFATQSDGNIDRVRGLTDDQLHFELRNIYYGAMLSGNDNALQRRSRELGHDEPINYTELVEKVRNKLCDPKFID